MENKDSKRVSGLFLNALDQSTVVELTADVLKELQGEEIERGGPGSGNHGHSGRPGMVGGSASGGQEIGRADAPDADVQFKFSGKSRIERKGRPAIEIAMKGDKGKGKFEIHGIADKDGKLVKGRVGIRVNGESVDVSHDELHTIRTQMRQMHEMNNRGVENIAGKKIARGNSLEVKIGDKTVTIPVHEQSVKDVNKAISDVRRDGYSLTAEPKRVIRAAVEKMMKGDPTSIVNEAGHSKAGALAAFILHSEKHSDKELGQMVKDKGKGKSPQVKKSFRNILAKFKEARSEAREARKKLSGTQAVKFYRKAAILKTLLHP